MQVLSILRNFLILWEMQLLALNLKLILWQLYMITIRRQLNQKRIHLASLRLILKSKTPRKDWKAEECFLRNLFRMPVDQSICLSKKIIHLLVVPSKTITGLSTNGISMKRYHKSEWKPHRLCILFPKKL